MATFKENLLQKVEIDRLANRVLTTLGPSGSGKKADLDAMRRLLDMGPYEHRKTRDMDLYFFLDDPEKKTILVLDNELPFYHTTADDVAMRKSPTVKEMISIRNAVKILNDQDVVTSKRETSVGIVRKACIQQLDLSFEEKDIDAIATDGMAALDAGDAAAVVQALTLFEELLGYVTPGRGSRSRGSVLRGESRKRKTPCSASARSLSSMRPAASSCRARHRSAARTKTNPSASKKPPRATVRPTGEGGAVFSSLKEKTLRASYDPFA